MPEKHGGESPPSDQLHPERAHLQLGSVDLALASGDLTSSSASPDVSASAGGRAVMGCG